jgi:RsiW-degrading membrane proteinase PrsW (M82 family)
LATFTIVLNLIGFYIGEVAMWEPIMTMVLVGLLFGTVISLVFISMVYSFLYKVKFYGYEFREELMK